MCTLALYFDVFRDYPVVVAANRDEQLARPSSAPGPLHAAPWIYGGQDLLAGGTWFGVNEYGVVIGILNRHSPRPADPQCRSRGLLCLDALKQTSATAAMQFALTQPALHYNPFTLVVADSSTAYVISPQGPTLQARKLSPGFYLLTNREPNDPACPRTARSLPRFLQLVQTFSPRPVSLPELFTQLHSLLADHTTSPDTRENLCLHLNGYGTCSSTLLAYSSRERQYSYHFAPGPPCHAAYEAVSVPPVTRASQPPSTI